MISDILDTLEEYATAYCAKDVDALMAVFDDADDISVIGTGADEICDNRDSIRNLFERNFRDATATSFQWHWSRVTRRRDSAVVAATLTINLEIEGEQQSVPVRWTIGLFKRPEGWKWTHRHASSASGNQEDGAAYPME